MLSGGIKVTLVYGSLQLGLLYGIMVLGIYISFRILNIPDLTTEGSFTFGLAVSAMMAEIGHPYLGLLLSVIVGAAAGCVTGVLQTKLKIHPVLAGIITMSGLHSINIFVLKNRANVSLMNKDTLFSAARKLFSGLDKDVVRLIVVLAAAVIVIVLLALFFKSHFGLCIRATGDNQDMLSASSVNVNITKIAALGLANACIAFAGGLTTQYQNYADLNSGTGMLVVGLASVIIGEAIFGKRGVTIGLVSAITGSVIYQFIISLATKYSIFPTQMFKLVAAVIVTVALAIPAIKETAGKMKTRIGGRRDA